MSVASQTTVDDRYLIAALRDEVELLKTALTTERARADAAESDHIVDANKMVPPDATPDDQPEPCIHGTASGISCSRCMEEAWGAPLPTPQPEPCVRLSFDCDDAGRYLNSLESIGWLNKTISMKNLADLHGLWLRLKAAIAASEGAGGSDVSVKRYDLQVDFVGASMRESSDGDYVEHDDYADLSRARDHWRAVAGQREQQRNAAIRHLHRMFCPDRPIAKGDTSIETVARITGLSAAEIREILGQQ